MECMEGDAQHERRKLYVLRRLGVKRPEIYARLGAVNVLDYESPQGFVAVHDSLGSSEQWIARLLWELEGVSNV